MRIPHPKTIGDPPYPPHYAINGRTKGCIFKSCPRVPKLEIWLLRGLGRSLKVTLQTCVPLVSMGGQAEGLAYADPGARTPIGTCGIFTLAIICPIIFSSISHFVQPNVVCPVALVTAVPTFWTQQFWTQQFRTQQFLNPPAPRTMTLLGG